MTTEGRYYSRGSSHRDDLNAVKQDVEVHRTAAADGIELIDAGLRELPETIEILAMRQDKEGIKKVVTIAKTANDAQEGFKKELADLDAQRKRVDQFHPRKTRQVVGQRDDYFKLGLMYMDLRERAGSVGSPFIDTVTSSIDAPTAASEGERSE